MNILESLPLELAFKVLEYLGVKDLLTCIAVSKGWKVLANADVLWKTHCLQEGLTQQEPLSKKRCSRGNFHYKYVKEKACLNNWKKNKSQCSGEGCLLLKSRACLLEDGRVIVYSDGKNFLYYDFHNGILRNVGHLVNFPPVLLSLPGGLVVSNACSMFSFAVYRWDKGSLSLWRTLHYKAKGQLVTSSQAQPEFDISERQSVEVLGALGTVVCLHVKNESSIVMWCVEKNLHVASLHYYKYDFRIYFQSDHMFFYNNRTITEYDSNGNETFKVCVLGIMSRVVQVISNKVVIVVEGNATPETLWFCNRVLSAWRRDTGSRLWRVLQDSHALLLHPSLPLLYIVPNEYRPFFQIRALDVLQDPEENEPLWESSYITLSSKRIQVGLDLVGPGRTFLSAVLYKYSPVTYALFKTERFLYDPLNGQEFLRSAPVGENRRLIWPGIGNLVFNTETTKGEAIVSCLTFTV